MIEHLPECPMANDCKHDYYNDPPIQCADCGESCICDQLRACEQRVFKKAREAISWTQDIDDALDALDALAAIDALKEKP